MSARSAGRERAEIELSQASRGSIPQSLLWFQAAIGGHGYVTSPRRGYLYYWRAGRRAQIEAVVQGLWPWLDEVERAQVRQDFSPEKLVITKRGGYLCIPGSAARSTLSNNFLERTLGVSATTRNFNTLSKLAAMAGIAAP